MWCGQVDLTPEFFPRLPVWPESQRGRFRCVHMGVNDHQQSCQQPLQCFHNGILIRSPHHPTELQSAPVCLFLVRLLLKMGNRTYPLWSTFLWGSVTLSGPKPFLRCPSSSANATILPVATEKAVQSVRLERGKELTTAWGHCPIGPGGGRLP